MTRGTRRPRRLTSVDGIPLRVVRRPVDTRPPVRGRARRRSGPAGSRLAGRLATVCVSAGCAGIPSVVLLELLNPTSAGLSAIGAIAVAAFSASGFCHRGRR